MRLHNGGNLDRVTIPFNIVQILPRDTVNDIVLSCTFNPTGSLKLSFRFAKITAIRLVGGDFCNERSPADCRERDMLPE
jgi:hypothetical protein